MVMRRVCHARQFSIKRGIFTYLPNSSSSTGVFGIEGLHKPENLVSKAKEAKRKCEILLDQALEAKPSTEVLDLIDELSDTACQVVDLAECCKTLHPDPNWRKAADDAYIFLMSYLDVLNTSKPTYQALCKIDPDNLDVEGKKMLSSLKFDMERNGIHLSDEDRDKVIELQGRIGQLTSQYQMNIYSRNDIEIKDVKRITAPSFGSRIVQSRMDLTATIPCDASVVNEILSWTSDVQTRRSVYLAHDASTLPNIQVLKSLVGARDQLAQLVGFPSFAHLTTNQMMSKRPERVLEQLDIIQESLLPVAQKELGIIRAQKEKDGHSGSLGIWDLHFYMGKIKAISCQIDSSSLSHYFSLRNCFRGLGILSERLFGAELRQVPMNPAESWIPESDANSTIYKFEMYDIKSGELLATVHMDLFQRSNKGGAACFALRCSKVKKGGILQVPKIVLTCSFSPSRLSSLWGVQTSSLNSGSFLLKHHEFETLLHEFGHALHLVFSRTRFQNLSGFRGPLDFVETPSHLMEYFAWDHRFLKLFATHYATGNTIPEDTVKRLRRSKLMFRALDTLSAVVRSKVDMMLFGPQPLKYPSHSELVYSVMKTLSVEIPMKPLWQTKFEHFTHYAAGYYSYLYGQMFADKIWKMTFQAEPLNTATGMRYRKLILEPGASKDPEAILASYLLDIDGINTQVDDEALKSALAFDLTWESEDIE
mmetsp:Transcript_2861/g.4358  ORF Transcript_2861/g.4358 Transcript_2861/m.4358 type:complete len:707 (-) Transcript_2861:163-2283(-)